MTTCPCWCRAGRRRDHGGGRPPGPKRLLLGGPDAVGVATVTAYATNGKELVSQRIELTPDTGADVALPDATALVTVAPERTSVRAAVLLTGTGTAVVRCARWC